MIKPKEVTDATLEIMQWLQDHEISVEDSPVVLGNALVNIVYSICLDRGADPMDGIKNITKDMRRLMSELPPRVGNAH